METHRVDAGTVKDLVEHLLTGAPASPAVRKLVSPRLEISVYAAPGQLAFLDAASGDDAATLSKSCKLISQAAEAIGLKWTARFLSVDETSLRTSSAPESQGARSSETWTAQVEWQLMYEPPRAPGQSSGKRFRLWTSSPRTVELIFDARHATSSTPPDTHARVGSVELVIHAAQAERSELELVAGKYSLWPTLPFPLGWVDAALPYIVKHGISTVQSRLLFAGLRLFITVFEPDQLEPTVPIASLLPDPEAPAPPIHLRHHQRHYEPELQAEPGPDSSSDPETQEPSHHYHRRRWSASMPQHTTPATTSAAARLHLERPLAERHLQPETAQGDAPRPREPAHAHPLPSSSGLARRGHVHAHQPGHPRHAHAHAHDHHADAHAGQHHHGHRHGLLYRVLKFPLELVALLVQVVQIIFFDFAAVSEFFGRMVEALMASVVTPRRDKETPGRFVQVEAEPRAEADHSRRVSFAESEPDAIPLNPPPSPHLGSIAEEGPASTTTPPPEGEGALESAYPRTLDLHGHLVSSSLIASLPIPIDVDAHALALHEQLASEAAAQGHFRAELEEAGVIAPPKVVPVSERDVEVHREVAKEVARVAGSMEHVERMAERFAAGGPELGDLVEQAGGVSTRSRTLGEHSMTSSPATQVVVGTSEAGEHAPLQAATAPFAVEPQTVISPIDRPELRKASSAPPSSRKGTAGQHGEAGAPSGDDSMSSSRAAAKVALQGRLGLLEPSSRPQLSDPSATKPDSSETATAEALLQATGATPQSESRRTSVGSITIGSSVGEALPRTFDDDEQDDGLALRMGMPLTSTPPPPPAEPTASASDAATATSIPFLPSLPIDDTPVSTPPERPATAAMTVQDPLMVMHGLGLGPEWRAKLSGAGGGSPGRGGVGVGGLIEAGESGVVWPYRQQQQQQAAGPSSGEARQPEQEQEQQQERSVDPPVRLAQSAQPVTSDSKLVSPAIAAGMVRSLSYSPASATLSPPTGSVVSPDLVRSASDAGTAPTQIGAGANVTSPSRLSDTLSGGSPASLRMQHELSSSGAFASSQGRLSTASGSPPPSSSTAASAGASGFAVEVAQGESGSSMGLAMSTRTPPPTVRPDDPAGLEIHPAHGYDEQVEKALERATLSNAVADEQTTAPGTSSEGNGNNRSTGRGGGGRGGGGRSGHRKKKSKGK